MAVFLLKWLYKYNFRYFKYAGSDGNKNSNPKKTRFFT